MKAGEFLGAYNISAQSAAFVNMPARASKAENELLKLGKKIEDRGRLYGEIFSFVITNAQSVSDLETDDEKKQALLVRDDVTGRFNEDLLPRINEYEQWLDNGLFRDNVVLGSYAKSDSKDIAQQAQNIQNHLFFHVLNDAAREQWHDFIDNGSIGIEPEKRTLNQNIGWLAAKGVMLIQMRADKINRGENGRSGYLTSTGKSEWRGELEGMLNEVDAGIALLEASIKSDQERAWVLPGPPQFEYLAGDLNADYIAVAARSQRALGIQVKSSGWTNGAPDKLPYVITVSGRHDLGNSFAMPRETAGQRHLRYDTYSYAGSLTLAAAARLPKSAEQLKGIYGDQRFIPVMAAAQANRKKRQTQLGAATERVGYKLHHAL